MRQGVSGEGGEQAELRDSRPLVAKVPGLLLCRCHCMWLALPDCRGPDPGFPGNARPADFLVGP